MYPFTTAQYVAQQNLTQDIKAKNKCYSFMESFHNLVTTKYAM